MTGKIGIMQGRLVPPVGDRIQAFPSKLWREEFAAAQRAGLAAIEWIYDVDGDDVNPIASDEGIAEMLDLSRSTNVRVDSLCADYFMPEPLLKGTVDERSSRVSRLVWLLDRCVLAGLSRIVLPFVDNSKVHGDYEIAELVSFLKSAVVWAAERKLELHLETSLAPELFALVMNSVNHPSLKVNYDSGNSSSLGFDVDEEFAAYGSFIGSVHIKDRQLGGSTVPLGQGDADFGKLARNLKTLPYRGDFILQVARDVSGDEVNWARCNRAFVGQLLARDF
jgi:L-ribulose-5-phosphate 3-epimerase